MHNTCCKLLAHPFVCVEITDEWWQRAVSIHRTARESKWRHPARLMIYLQRAWSPPSLQGFLRPFLTPSHDVLSTNSELHIFIPELSLQHSCTQPRQSGQQQDRRHPKTNGVGRTKIYYYYLWDSRYANTKGKGSLSGKTANSNTLSAESTQTIVNTERLIFMTGCETQEGQVYILHRNHPMSSKKPPSCSCSRLLITRCAAVFRY